MARITAVCHLHAAPKYSALLRHQQTDKGLYVSLQLCQPRDQEHLPGVPTCVSAQHSMAWPGLSTLHRHLTAIMGDTGLRERCPATTSSVSTQGQSTGSRAPGSSTGVTARHGTISQPQPGCGVRGSPQGWRVGDYTRAVWQCAGASGAGQAVAPRVS